MIQEVANRMELALDDGVGKVIVGNMDGEWASRLLSLSAVEEALEQLVEALAVVPPTPLRTSSWNSAKKLNRTKSSVAVLADNKTLQLELQLCRHLRRLLQSSISLASNQIKTLKGATDAEDVVGMVQQGINILW
jgi:hypothetical protein